jgi:hypothetical protein
MKRTPLKRSTKPMKRKRLSPRSRATRPNLIAACDRLWAFIVKANAGEGHYLINVKCEWCPNAGTEAHHMVARRRSLFLRHHPSNGVWLCPSCHRRFHDHESLSGWQHFEQMRPEDLQCVKEHMWRPIPVSQADLQDTLAFLLELAKHRGWEPGERDGPLLSRAA